MVCNIRLDASSAPTNYASVLLLVLIFCFRDIDTIDHFPIVNLAPVRDLKSKSTTNYASTYNFIPLVLSTFNVRHNSWVTTIYFISLSILFQSHLLGCFTLVHKTVIVVCISDLALLPKNKPLATVVRNNYYLLFFRGLFLSTLNRSWFPGLLLPTIFRFLL